MNKTKENLLIGKESDEQEVTLMESDNEVSSEVLFEDTSKRSENVKHFRMKNGQYMAAVYDKPVHSFDKATGKFVDIAHHFNEKDDCYEAETDRFKARFPKKEGKRKFVTMEKDGHSVSWRYIPATDSHKKRPEAAIHKHERVSLMELPGFPTLKYEKTESRTDLEYGITDQGVKENIILSKRPKNTTFRFELKLEGLRAVLTEDKKSVQLFADDAENSEPEFIIPPINMMDDAGVYSEAAHYELSKGENCTVLEIVVDPEWLLAEERIFPVTVDPQVNIPGTKNAGNMKMVTVCSDGSTVTDGDSRKVGVDFDGKKHRLFIQIPLPKLPDGFKITQAGVDLTQRSYATSGQANNYVVHPTSGWWGNGEKNWENQPSSDTTVVIDSFEGLNRRRNSPLKLDLTDFVNQKYKDKKTTAEFVIQAPDAETTATSTITYNSGNILPFAAIASNLSSCGTTTSTPNNCPSNCENNNSGNDSGNCTGNSSSSGTGSSSGSCTGNCNCKCNECNCTCQCKVCPEFIEFFSDSAISAYKASAYIVYISEDTYSDHQKFETFENGRAGTCSINLFTGKLSYAHGDVMAEGVKLPLAVSHVYRDNFLDEKTNRYGRGWRLSVEQTLKVFNEFGVKAVYTDAKGKLHYFLDSDEDKISDDAGLGLYFEEGCCSDGCEAYRLHDDKGNIMRFNSAGKLYQMVDSNGNKSTLSYSSDGKLKTVVDGSRNTARFEYDAQGRLSQIIDTTDSEDRAIKYSYDDQGHLTTITYPSSSNAPSYEGDLKIEFTYDEENRLSSVTDMTGMKYDISYDSDGKVIKVSEYGTLEVTPHSVTSVNDKNNAESISFEYRSRSTAVVNDKKKIKTVYRFDENGRELSSYEDLSKVSDTALRSESTPTNISSYNSILSTTTQTRKVGKYRSLSVSISGAAGNTKNYLRNGCFTEGTSILNPTGWAASGVSSATDGVSNETYLDNKKSYCFSAKDTAKTRTLTQTVTLCDCKIDGNVLVASAWAKASNPVQNTSDDSTAKFRLYLKLSYENGEVAEYSESFDSNCTDKWQYVAIPFVLERDCKPVQVTYRLDFSNNTGSCYFTNARLIATYGTVTTNEYKVDDSDIAHMKVFDTTRNIRLISTVDDGILKTKDYQDENTDTVCTVVTDLDGNSFYSYYEYDENHNILKTEDYRGTVTEYTYDKESGKQSTQKTYHKTSETYYMYSEMKYDNGFLTQESDPRQTKNGKTLKTSYEYDKDKGLLTKRTDTSGQEYNYTYDDRTDDLKTLATTVNEKSHENRFFYTKGYLTKVEHNGFHFGFSFDAKGRNTKICVGDDAKHIDLLTTKYETDSTSETVITKYATGESNEIHTDLRGNPVSKTYTPANGSAQTVSTAKYDEVGNPIEMVDKVRGICYNYIYDSDGNVTKVTETANGSSVSNTTSYDKHKRVTAQTYGATGQTYRTIYEKDAKNRVYPDGEAVGITLDKHFTDQIARDGLGRAKTRTLDTLTGSSKNLITENFNYLATPQSKGVQIETNFVSSITHKVNGSTTSSSELNYAYNDAGNIETVCLGTNLLVKYYYDGLNRLVREDNYSAGNTYVWLYDVGGNITEKRTYALTADINLGAYMSSIAYAYATSGWRDQLTSFNGEKCEYDSNGNPTKYRNHTLKWSHIRRLDKYDSHTFAYGADGIRYRKNNIVYTLNGNRILAETDTSKNKTLTYYYGGSGVVGFAYNGTDFYYKKNLQGDITAIYDANGTLVAEYVYNAWGQVLKVNNYTSANIGDLNPFRYRSYYYDSETGLYYLNNRYYDPEVGRFISSDTTEVLDNAKDNIGGLNLYAYCDNNPVSGRDDDGNMSFWKKLAIAAAVVVAVAVVAAVVTVATGGGAAAALCAVGSTFLGAAKGAVVGAVTGAVAGAVTGAVTGAVEGYKEDGWDGVLSGMGKGALKGAVQGAEDGLLSGMVMGGIGGAMNPSLCFVAGTAVLTSAGHRAIEDIKVGDVIPCVDYITGERSEKRVVSTFSNKTDTLINLEIGGETICCTETHPFHVKDKGWVNADKLQVGDLVYDKDWNTAPITRVKIVKLDKPVEVYNFEVENYHTYYVGNGCWLVHNGCKQQLVAGDKESWNARVSVGGEANHATPHAHIFYKNQKVASVTKTGDILVESFGKLKGGPKFIKNHIGEIAKGIEKWWFYGG